MLIIAHRGASGEFPENTLLAFEQAIKQGCDAIELDAQWHQSGEFVVLHDSYVDKISTETGHFNDFSLDELLNIHLPRNQHIVTLKQALIGIQGRCTVNIELKTKSSDAQLLSTIANKLNELLTILTNQGTFQWSQFVISSFNHLLLKTVAQTNPLLSIAALVASCPIKLAELAEHIPASGLNPDINCLNESLVSDAHKKGLSVWVYTVDKKQDIDYCRSLNIDGIFTNYPAKTRQYLSQ